jgi:hypothetical protein
MRVLILVLFLLNYADVFLQTETHNSKWGVALNLSPEVAKYKFEKGRSSNMPDAFVSKYNANISANFGYNLGFLAVYKVNNTISFLAGFGFSQKSYKFLDDSFGDPSSKIGYTFYDYDFNVPIRLNYQHGKGSWKIVGSMETKFGLQAFYKQKYLSETAGYYAISSSDDNKVTKRTTLMPLLSGSLSLGAQYNFDKMYLRIEPFYCHSWVLHNLETSKVTYSSLGISFMFIKPF